MIETINNLFNKLNSINSSYNSQNFEIEIVLINCIICGIAGFLVFYLNSYTFYKFLREKVYLYVAILLPAIGYIITAIIGNNIALSLGMIGALSIVRFRTPIRSSYELVLYFGLLTIGIAANVNIKLSIVLSLLMIFAGYILNVFGYFQRFIEKSNYIKISFIIILENSDIKILTKDKTTQSLETIDLKSKKFSLIKFFNNEEEFELFKSKYEEKIENFEIIKNINY